MLLAFYMPLVRLIPSDSEFESKRDYYVLIAFWFLHLLKVRIEN